MIVGPKHFMLVFAILVLASPAEAKRVYIKNGESAVLTLSKKDAPFCSVAVVGPILKKTYSEVLAADGKCGKRAESYAGLYSLGGDIEAAVAIGRFLRKKGYRTVVHEVASCASACALIHMAGVYRAVYGQFGIHRPHSVSNSKSIEEAQQKYQAINMLVGAYLREMNFSSNLLDAMNAVPPDEVKWLTTDELINFGLIGDDPVVADFEASKAAAFIKISKTEYYNRLAKSRTICDSDDFECAYKVVYENGKGKK